MKTIKEIVKDIQTNGYSEISLNSKKLGVFDGPMPGIIIYNDHGYLNCVLVDLNADDSEICAIEYPDSEFGMSDYDDYYCGYIDEDNVRGALEKLINMVKTNLIPQIKSIK